MSESNPGIDQQGDRQQSVEVTFGDIEFLADKIMGLASELTAVRNELTAVRNELAAVRNELAAVKADNVKTVNGLQSLLTDLQSAVSPIANGQEQTLRTSAANSIVQVCGRIINNLNTINRY